MLQGLRPFSKPPNGTAFWGVDRRHACGRSNSAEGLFLLCPERFPIRTVPRTTTI